MHDENTLTRHTQPLRRSWRILEDEALLKEYRELFYVYSLIQDNLLHFRIRISVNHPSLCILFRLSKVVSNASICYHITLNILKCNELMC